MFGWVYEYSNGVSKRIHQYGQLKKRSMVMLSSQNNGNFKDLFVILFLLFNFLFLVHSIFYWTGNDCDFSIPYFIGQAMNGISLLMQFFYISITHVDHL